MRTPEQYASETATGCRGAGDFRKWAEEQGYPFCEVFDWTSSAGDWAFVVSRDGHTWYPMFQENAYPSPGFRRSVDESQPMEGSAEEVLEYMAQSTWRN